MVSDIRCPNCNTPLTMAELAGDWCEQCGKKIPAFIRPTGTGRDEPASRVPESEPPPTPRPSIESTLQTYVSDIRRLQRRRQRIALAILGLLAAGAVCYFVFRSDVEVYVDNGGKDSVTVFLDGSPQFEIAPGALRKFDCRSGDRCITAKRGDKVVFDETKKLKGGGKSGPRRYLLNPEATNRYRLRTVNYGMSFPTFGTYFNDEDKCRQMIDGLQLQPVSAWIDVHPDYVLEKPPSSVQGQYSDTRHVLVRVARSDCDQLTAINERWKADPFYSGSDEKDIDKRFQKENEWKEARRQQVNAVEAIVKRVKAVDE